MTLFILLFYVGAAVVLAVMASVACLRALRLYREMRLLVRQESAIIAHSRSYGLDEPETYWLPGPEEAA